MTILKKSGFTLVELLVVIAILAVLAGIIIFIINPQRQLQKARDARRLDDLSQISSALGKYSVDQEGYPLSTPDYQITNAPFGQAWQPYMVKVPQDPLAGQSYAYSSDGKTYALYAKLENPDSSNCTLCGPGGEYNYGITSSSKTTLTSLPAAPPSSPSASITPSPSPSPTPPPPAQRYSGSLTGSISTSQNPRMTSLMIDPFDPVFGADQTLTVTAQDSSSPISQISATLRTDKGSNTYALNLISGTNNQGSWQGTWKATDSHEQIYNLTLTATNQNGQSSKVDIQFEVSLKNLRSKQ